MEDLRPALIPPRVSSPITGDPILLVGEIQGLLHTKEAMTVLLMGDGKSSAIEFLRQTFDGDHRLFFHDADEDCQVFLTHVKLRGGGNNLQLRLCNWQRDAFIEYLLATAPEQCSSVMKRLSDQDISFGNGSPCIWRLILDAMARDESLVEVAVSAQIVVRSHFRNLTANLPNNLSHDELLAELADIFLKFGYQEMLEKMPALGCDRAAIQLLRIGDVARLIAADRFAQQLEAGEPDVLNSRMNIEFLRLIAKRIIHCMTVRDLLTDSIGQRNSSIAASLLLLLDPLWRPPPVARLNVTAGYFAGARWADCRFSRATFCGAKLAWADLQNAHFSECFLSGVNFESANLQNANLSKVEARRANFHKAQLDHCDASEGNLQYCNFSQASVRHANFAKANLTATDLSFTDFSGSNLARGKFRHTIFHNTCLQSCDLAFANLSGCDLRGALLGQTNFSNARLDLVDLEDVDLANCVFDNAKLHDSLLSGSQARRASFAIAVFCGAGLAEVNWEDCDLRECDLRKVSFHLGSTRCGLVDSPYPSHGTRTRFYTDDFEDLYFKRPEQIRKAALCGCDFRGARITDTDFYLVDLRDAKYDHEQRKHFLACGAIL